MRVRRRIAEEQGLHVLDVSEAVDLAKGEPVAVLPFLILPGAEYERKVLTQVEGRQNVTVGRTLFHDRDAVDRVAAVLSDETGRS